MLRSHVRIALGFILGTERFVIWNDGITLPVVFHHNLLDVPPAVNVIA